MKFIYITIAILFLSSCDKLSSDKKFNKTEWMRIVDSGFVNADRNKMVNDLIKNYKIENIKYSELIELLGEPNYKDSASLQYTLIMDYGNDIDPVYVKSLQFTMSKDFVIKSYEIKEWKK